MEYVTLDLGNNLRTVEHRACVRLPVARLAVSFLIYVKLGNKNGGIALNISEGGLALSAANDLLFERIPELSIQLPDSGPWIRTAGQITWRSNKKCGIRFVCLDEGARQRIREWIAAETSNASPAPKPESNAEPESKNALQNVELEDTSPTLGDTIVSKTEKDKSASNAEPAAAVGSHCALQETEPDSKFGFTEATAFTREENEDKGVADRRTPTAPVLPVNPYYPEAVLDRRFNPRKRIIPLGYVQLGDKNGGIALNVSEGGFSIIAANVLLEDSLPSIRLQFPDKRRWVDVKGEIVWRSESKKEAGVRFVDLAEQTRLQLRNWLWSSAPPLAVEGPAEPIRKKGKDELPLTALRASEISSVGPIPDSFVADKTPKKIPEGFPALTAERPAEPIRRKEKPEPLTALRASEISSVGPIPDSSPADKAPNRILQASPLVAVKLPAEPIRGREKTEVPLTARSVPELSRLGPILDSSPADKASARVPEAPPPPLVDAFANASSPPVAHPRVKSRARSKPVKRDPRVVRVKINGGCDWMKPKVLLRAGIAAVALLVLVAWPPPTKPWFSFRPHGTKRTVEVVAPRQSLGTEIAEVAPQSPPANVATPSQPQRPEARQEANGKLALPKNSATASMPTIPSPAANVAKVSQPQRVDAPQEANGKAALPKNSAIANRPTIPLKDKPNRVNGAQRPLAATATKELVHSLRETPRLNQGNSSATAVPVTSPALPTEQPRVASAPPTPGPQEEARLAPALIPVISPPRSVEAPGAEKNSTKNGGESPVLQKSTEAAGRIKGTVAVTTDPYPSIRFAGKPKGKKARDGTSLRLGQLVSRVDPAYPVEAAQRGVQGTVKIHVIVSPQGSIKRLESVDGPPLLVPAAVRAVQQWRYSQTLLAGQPVETEDDIAVTFGLWSGINR